MRAATALVLLALCTCAEAAPDADPRSGLIIDEGWVYANAHCGACHSYALVTAQRGDAEFWLSTIRWMQRTQKLWQIPEDQETALISYLTRNYNEDDWGRRPPLPPSLLPSHASEAAHANQPEQP